MYNGGVKGKRAGDGSGFVSSRDKFVQTLSPIPTATSWSVVDGSYNPLDDTAAAVGSTVIVYGSGFTSTMTVTLGTTTVTPTLLDSNRILFTVPSLSNGTYAIIISSGSAAAIISPGVLISPFPTWSVSSYTTSSLTVNVQLLATGDAPLNYYLMGGSSLPAGLSLSSSGLISGTVSGVTTGTSYTFTVIVDDSQLQSSQQLITLTFSLNDPQFPYTTLLLNGETAVKPFINDASTNNLGLTIAGDTRADKFNPYQSGYYSLFFNGAANDHLTMQTAAGVFDFGTGDFTFEFWYYTTSFANTGDHYDLSFDNGVWQSGVNTGSTSWNFEKYGSGWAYFVVPNAAITSSWTHIAVTRSSGTMRGFVNGVLQVTATGKTDNLSGSGLASVNYRPGNTSSDPIWYSNIRSVIGTAVYTANFTVPTSPLPVISGTKFLTASNNNLTDSSPYNASITTTGSPKVSSAHPFTSPTSVTVNTGYSVYFNGSTDYVTVGSFALSSFTVEGWFYATSYPGSQNIIFATPFNSNNFQIFVNNNNTFTWQAYNQGIGTAPAIPGLNTWTHFAVVKTGTTVYTYINGVLKDTATSQTNTYSGTAYIGARGADGLYFQGFISNFRIVNGVQVYTGNFTPPATQLTVVQSANGNIGAITAGQTVLLTCQGASITDISGTVSPFIFTGTPKVVNNNYPFTQTTTTISNLNTLGSAYFDGTGDYITIPATTAFGIGTGDFTYEAWYYPTGTSTGNLFDFRTGAGDTVFSDYFSTYAPVVYINSTNVATSSIALVKNQWNHVAYTRSGTTIRIFVNGVQGASATSAYNMGTSQPLRIGTNTVNTDYINGYVTDWRVTKGVALYTSNFVLPLAPLTAGANTSMVSLQYNGGGNNYGIVDNSNFNSVVTRYGNATQGTFSPFSQTGWSTYFTGTSGLQTPASSLTTILGTSGLITSTFTIEAWIYITTRSGSTDGALVGDMAPAAGTNNWSWGPRNDGKLNFNWYNGSTINCTGTSTLALNTWYHVALVIATTSIKMFVNGVLETLTGTTTLSAPSSSLGYLGIGMWNSGTSGNNMYAGYVSNLRIVKSALYSTNFTPSTTPLTAVNNTSLLLFQNNNFTDLSGNSYTQTVSGTPSVQAFSPFSGMTTAPTSYSTYFPATANYLTGSNSIFNISATNVVWTIEFWVYPIALGNIFAIGSGSSYGNSFYIDWGRTTANKFTTGQGNGSSNPVAITTTNTYTAGVWYHVAVTRTSAGVTTLFVNGTADGTQTYNAATVAAGTTYVVNGLYDNNGLGNGGGTFNISNLRVLIGTALYTSNFTPSTTPLTSITNTQLLTCQSSSTVDKSGNNITVSQSGTPKVLSFNPFGQTVTASGPYAPAVNGGSGYFDGTGDYVSVPAATQYYILSGGDFTMDCWVYLNTTTGTVWNLSASTTNSNGFSWRISASTKICEWVWPGTAAYPYGPALALNSWNHLAITRSGNNIVGWVNGVSYTVTSVTRTADAGVATSIANDSSQTTAYFNGYMTDFRMFRGISIYSTNFYPPNAPITPTATVGAVTYTSLVALNFNNGGIVDAHSSTVFEPVAGVQLSTSNKKYGNSSMYFAGGASNSIQFPSTQTIAFGTGDFTIECWINFATNNGTYNPFVRFDGTGTFDFGYDFSTTQLKHSAAAGILAVTQTFTVGTWYHVALTRASGSCRLFVNGTQVGTTVTGNTDNYAAGLFKVGGSSYSTAHVMSGYIDELRITKGFARYVANFTPNTVALVTQ